MRIVYPYVNQSFFCRLTWLFLLTMVISVLTVFNANGQTTVTIGAGASSGTSSNGATGDPGPMYRSTATSTFVYSRHHYLYTQAELAAAGIFPGQNITKLAWNKDNVAGSNSTFTFQIWMKNSSLTDVGPGGQNWADLINGSTQVYNNTAENLASPAQWHEFVFSSPFLYTGGAIEISVNFDISSGSSPWTTAGFSWKKDPITNRTLSYVGSSAPGATLPNLRTVRPQIQITTVPAGPCTSPPTPGSATANPATAVCTGETVMIGLSGNSTGSGQTYQLQTSSTAGGTYTDVGSSQNSPTFNVTVTSSAWYRIAVTCSGNTTNSTPVQVVMNPAFPGGTYTIGGSPSPTNFATFQSAVNALSCGIAGPVVFNVTPGTYTEQVVIPEISGTSATNRITFNGNGATLAFSPTVSAERSVLLLDGADYITINNLTIDGTGGTYGWVVHLTNQADNNTIINSSIRTDIAATSTNYAGIVMSGSLTSATTAGNSANNTLIRNNSISGGYYGITAMGTTTTFSSNNTIDSNTINNAHFYNIYSANQEDFMVRGNNISRTDRTNGSTFYGVYLTTAMKSAIVEGNRIHNTNDAATSFTNAVYGIYVNGPAATGFETKVYNNIIYNINNSGGLIYALYLNDAGIRAWHNSVSLEDGAATAGTTRGIMVGNYANVEVKNNNVVITRGGTGTKHGIYSAGSSLVENNNVVYVPVGNFGFWGADMATLTDWRTASGQGSNSLDIDPQYVSPSTGNLFPGNVLVDDKGVFVGVTYDILKVTRNTSTPDPGAYEIPPSAGIDLGVKALKLPLVKNCYSASETVTVTLRNYSANTHDFVANPVTINSAVTGAANVTFPAVVINTGTLASGDTLNVEVSNNLNMSTVGGYTFSASSTVTGDVRNANNAMPATTITVSALAAGTAASDRSSYCLVGGTPVISLSGNAGGDIQWQESTTSTGPWTNVGTNSTSYSPSAAITSTMYYRAELSCGAGTATSNVVTVTLENPQILSTAGDSRCGPGTVTLGATSSPGTVINWYAAPTGGTKLGTGTSFTTPFLTATANFYAEAVSGVGGADSIAVPLASGGTTGVYNHMFLVSSPTGLTMTSMGIKANQAVGTMTSWEIYYRPDNYQTVPGANTSSAGWTLLSTISNVPSQGVNEYTIITPAISLEIPAGATYSFHIVPLGGSTHQYATTAAGTVVVSNTNASLIAGHRGSAAFGATTSGGMPVVKIGYSLGCSGTRSAVLARIDPPPALTAAGTGTVCNDAIRTLSITSNAADFTTYTWSPSAGLYTDAAATVPYTGSNVTTVYARTTTPGAQKFYLNASNSVNGCTNIDSVTVNTLPTGTAITATLNTICISGTTTLTLSPSSGYDGASIQWFTSADGVSYTAISGATGTSYTTPVLTTTTYYKTEIKNTAGSICMQPTFTVTVYNPQVLSTTPGTRCGAGTVDLAATASAGANLKWYSDPTGGTPLGSGANFTTPAISSTTTFYVAADIGSTTTTVGLSDITGATSGAGTTNFGIVFDALAPFTLESVMVYAVHATPGTPGTVTIDVIDGTGAVVHTATVNVTGNPAGSPVGERVTLNFNIQPGTNYKLRPGARTGVTGLLFGPSAAAPPGGNYGYPFTIPGLLSINTSTLTAAPTNTARNDLYYYFYDWHVITGCEGAARTPVTATVKPATVFTTHPASQVYCGTGSVTFTAAATGDGTPTYQWYKDGIAISGETNATYTIASPVPADMGNYTVTASACNTVTSNTATLSAGTPASITTQPVAQTVCDGSAASFTVVASGSGLTYQWRKDGTPIGGATSATLNIAGAAAADAGSYDVVVTGTCGSVTSAAVALAVDPAPVASFSFAPGTPCNSYTFTNTSTISAGTIATTQWDFGDGTPVSTTANPTHIFAAEGLYNVKLVVASNAGCPDSVIMAVTVNMPVTITGQPVAQSVCAGSNATFSVTATGSGTLTYQWRKGGTDITGATSSSLTLTNVTAADAANYDVVVTGSCGADTSAAAALTLNAETVINTQPAAQAVCAGATATFTVAANGTSLTYQWRKGGTDISGATSATLTINNAATADAASYDVVVTGTCGSDTSAAAALTLNAETLISTQPQAQTVCAGAAASFTVAATGTNLTYQWRKGGAAITGATSATLTINNAAAADAASYDVVVTGACGSVTSSAVSLTVNAATAITTQPQAQTACTGANASFSVTATGAGITYQWRKGGTNITGATSATLTINNAAAADAGSYDVVVTGTCGTVTSNAVTLTVNTCTSIPAVDTDVTSVVLMPNVFQNNTLLRVKSARAVKINWSIMDARGRVVMTFSRNVLAGQTDLPLMLRHLAGGVYYLSGETTKGRTETLRFIKL